MSERAHIIEIDRIVLDGVDHLRPGERRRLIEREVSRALRRAGTSAVRETAVNEQNVAEAVAGSVENATLKGGQRHTEPR